MRTFLTLIVILLVIAGLAGAYLFLTTPHETGGVAFPLSASSRAAIASIPDSAETFIYVPHAAALHSRLVANPVTRDVVTSWTSERAMPRPWIVGGADLVAWQSGKETRYLLRLDPLRTALARVYLMFNDSAANAILINAPGGPAIAPDEIAKIEQLASKLPQGDALVVQRATSRGAFPPINRPAVFSVRVTPSEIDITSRAERAPTVPSTLKVRLTRGALLSASFTSAPRVFDDLNRLFGKRVSDFIADGGSVALYDVDTAKLLPRPLGVISVPLTAERRPTAETLTKYGARTAEKGDELVIAFDDSIGRYLKDTADASDLAGGVWAARIDAQRMAPILNRIKDNLGLRIASPRLFRAARDLERWIGSLEQAGTIEATDVTDGSTDELKVRISAK